MDLTDLFVLVGKLPASRVDVFAFTAAYVDHDVFAFEEADELIPVSVQTVVIGGVVYFVVFYNVNFHGKLPTEQS